MEGGALRRLWLVHLTRPVQKKMEEMDLRDRRLRFCHNHRTWRDSLALMLLIPTHPLFI
jgi:hypothetical protein